MKTHGWTALTVGVFLGGWGLATPPSAEACGRPFCTRKDSRVPLPPDATVPANVPALVVVPPAYEWVEEQSLRLRTADGLDVEARLLKGPDSSGVLVPADPLIPGTRYHLEGSVPCSDGHTGKPFTAMADFTAGPKAALPTATGVLQAGAEQHGVIRVWDSGASCSSEILGSQVMLGFTPAPELVPFLPWVHWKLEVDGQTWATAPHGAVDASGGAWPADGFRTMRDLLTVYTLCGNESPSLPPSAMGLAPGTHVATLRPVLEQSGTALPALEASFELTCLRMCGCADGGSWPVLDAGSDPDEDLAPKAKGCSQAGGGLSVLGVLAALRPWRRRTA
ncbi:hypothetical protein [Corallococcus aberystwythensis]|uniref:Uncharacterized protein n=1 Tax=Corallococcus aberystwythensis TaxID=2316722 RepID=A0A3A8QFM8_9BACT|nr:hypothetical protein [Corallococcus aberystwythensis]RKH67457.1 hypothetical protein D7W81_13870 [Corallococcus aberystwythensis]